MSTFIKTLKDRSGNYLLPRTRTTAITDLNGVNLDTLLGQCIKSTSASAATPIPVDADTLQSHPASYFATSSEIAQIKNNPNLLDNPFFTINQRGLSTYSGNTGDSVGYTIDRWRLTGSSTASLTLNNNYITYSGNGNCNLSQIIEGNLSGKTVTISIKCSNPSNAALYFRKTDWSVLKTVKITSEGITSFAVTVPNNYTDNCMITVCAGEEGESVAHSIDIYSAKVEYGSVSTLINSMAPNYTEELLKCQRYYHLYGTSSKRPAHMYDCDPHMRATPTQGTITVSGSTYYYNSADL